MPKLIFRSLNPAELEALCRALAHTTEGLTGPEIAHALNLARIADVEPTATKWKRLHNALAGAQMKDNTATSVTNFIYYALAPARYTGQLAKFRERQEQANSILIFLGLRFTDAGQFAKIEAATTLQDAQQRASGLRSKLQNRGVHPDVLKFCKAELLTNNYFHAVQEACKSVTVKLKALSGLTGDGAEVFDQALGGSDPVIRINAFAKRSEKSEQSGFGNLLKGMYGTFRNPTTHEAKIEWPMSEEDALDLFSLASYAHRRLDKATKRP